MKAILLASTLLFILSACSVKEINSTTDSIISDVTKVFNDSKDKSTN